MIGNAKRTERNKNAAPISGDALVAPIRIVPLWHESQPELGKSRAQYNKRTKTAAQTTWLLKIGCRRESAKCYVCNVLKVQNNTENVPR